MLMDSGSVIGVASISCCCECEEMIERPYDEGNFWKLCFVGLPQEPSKRTTMKMTRKTIFAVFPESEGFVSEIGGPFARVWNSV